VSTTILIDQHIMEQAGADPLGVRSSCAIVVNALTAVAIDPAAIAALAGELAANQASPPEWDDAIHFHGRGDQATEQTIGWIFALDALNFCFWGQAADRGRRWRIASGGTIHDGYMALAIALRDAAQQGIPVWDPAWQATVDHDIVASLLRPAPDSVPIPLLAERVANLRELGKGIHSIDSGDHPYTTFVERAGGSAPALVRLVVETFPSFNDVARWTPPDGTGAAIEVRLYKRAQILVSDLSGALQGRSAIDLADQDRLTAFADYKVPQVLRHHGILRYRDDLAATIHDQDLLPPGSRAEVEIRAATIWACELLRQRLASLGRSFTAAGIDWLLWNQGQALPATREPYHRTVTIYY
jgi:hypothetical protein